MSLVDRWRLEYEQEGIPSSFREEPSGSVQAFAQFLEERQVKNGIAVDLGCGRGRNSLFLAKLGFFVYSFDFVPEAIQALQRDAEELGVSNRIYARCQSVSEKWPVEDQLADIAIDAFVYKHLIPDSEKRVYRMELDRVLKPRGYYLLTLADVDDGYYGPLLSNSPEPERNVIVDPAIGIGSILYSKADIEREFSMKFDLVAHTLKARPGHMHGQEYLRKTHVFIFQRKET
jgi:SAM-dependent methyltransferase